MLNRFIVGILIFSGGLVLGWAWHDHWPTRALPQRAQESRLPVFDATDQDINSSRHNKAGANVIGSTISDTIKLTGLLNERQYEEAIQQYISLVNRSDEDSIQSYKNTIFQHAYDLKSSGQFRHAIELLTLYLDIEFRDVEGRELLAEIYHSHEDYLAELNTLFEARAYAYRSASQVGIINRIRSAVSAYRSLLNSNNDWKGLHDLYETLTQLEPDNPNHFVGLATAKLQLGDYAGSRQSLALIMYDPTVSNEVKLILSSLEKADSLLQENEIPGIPLERRGDHFLVAARINNATTINLLIDTGASLTMIKSEVLASSGVNIFNTHKYGRFNTANGSVQAPIFIITELTVGNQTLGELEVGAVELSVMPNVDGLLGMNYLKHFRFFIDQQNNVLRLSPKSFIN